MNASLRALWAANLLGPAAVLLGMELGYAFVRPACASGSLAPVHAAFALVLCLALGAGAAGWREWRRAELSERSRFLATVGVMLSALSTLVILLQWAANLFLHPCQ